MKKNSKLLALIAILAALCLVLAGCGGDDADSAPVPQPENSGVENPAPAPEPEPEPTVPYPVEDWFEELLYGSYVAEGLYAEYRAEEDYTNFLDGMKYRTIQVYSSDEEVSVLPWQFDAFPVLNDVFNMSYAYQKVATKEAILNELITLHGEETGAAYYQNFLKFSELNAMEQNVVDAEGASYYQTLVYRTEGNRVILSSIELDNTTYEYTLTDEYEYTIYRDGVDFILGCDGVYVRYRPQAFGGRNDPTYIYAIGSVIDDTCAYMDIVEFFIHGDYDFDADGSSTTVYFANGDCTVDAYHKFNDDDTITIGWTQLYTDDGVADDPFEFTCEYLLCDNYGLILIVDGNYYLYQTPDEVYRDNALAGLDTEGMFDNEVEELVSTQKDILQALIEAFEAAGISVDIDRANGKIALDAQFLFGKNETAVSDEGKAYLDDFLGVYTSVVLSEEYSDCISEIVVEGHTDNEGSYNYNMSLSEDRAASVYDYCVSVNEVLADMISTKGCAYNELVYNEDGTVNMDASRRVTFRFVLKTTE